MSGFFIFWRYGFDSPVGLEVLASPVQIMVMVMIMVMSVCKRRKEGIVMNDDDDNVVLYCIVLENIDA